MWGLLQVITSKIKLHHKPPRNLHLIGCCNFQFRQIHSGFITLYEFKKISSKSSLQNGRIGKYIMLVATRK